MSHLSSLWCLLLLLLISCCLRILILVPCKLRAPKFLGLYWDAPSPNDAKLWIPTCACLQNDAVAPGSLFSHNGEHAFNLNTLAVSYVGNTLSHAIRAIQWPAH